MGKVQFGLIVPEIGLTRSRRHLYMQDVNRLLTAVKGYFDSAWCIDHLQQDVLKGWTAVTYLSALHPELMWGNMVLCQSFRNPALLAKMGATLQFMSGAASSLASAQGDRRLITRRSATTFRRGAPGSQSSTRP